MKWRARLRADVYGLGFDVELEGEVGAVALIGPNGSGKTTLLRWLAGAPVNAQLAEFQLDGELLVDSGQAIWLAPESRGVGYVPQGLGLFEHLTALDNVAFAYRCAGESRGAARERAGQWLAHMNGQHLSERPVRQLSGGERQKVALARALARRPRFLLLDEPMAALDAQARAATRSYLRDQLAKAKTPALIVSHDARDVHVLAAHVAVMEAGKICQSGTPAEVAAAPTNDFARAFFDWG